MYRLQERYLQHIQEQEKNQGKVGAIEALRFLPQAHKAHRIEG
jgi:hypothetical protein